MRRDARYFAWAAVVQRVCLYCLRADGRPKGRPYNFRM